VAAAVGSDQDRDNQHQGRALTTIDEIDALFAAPLADFVAERKRIAQALKGAGRRDDAKVVAATPKPTLPIWIINQLARREPALVKDLDALTAQLRGAEGPEYAAGVVNHRRALAELRWKAEELLTETGHAAPPAVLNRVIANLRAAAAGDDTRPLLIAGRLTRDVEEPGFADLFGQGAAAQAAAPARAPASAPAANRAADAREKREPAASEREQAAAARAQQRERERALASAERQSKQLRATDAAARAALAREERTRDSAREALERAEARVEAARVEASAAASELAAADAEVARLREA
jgi:hypothetical protein